MLQLDVPLYRIGCNAAYKVRRYGHLLVTSELISDVEGFILKRAHEASTNNKRIRLRRISAFLPPASRVSNGGLL